MILTDENLPNEYLTDKYLIGITAHKQELENAKKLDDKAYANFKQDGVSYMTPYFKNELGDISWSTENQSETKTKQSSKLLEQMKNGSDAFAEALDKLTKAQNEGNKISQELVRATQNMGGSLFSSILAIATELTKGNKYHGITSQINSIVGETQIKKNVSQADYYEFMNNGKPEIVDLNGNPIKPNEYKMEQFIKKHELENQGLYKKSDELFKMVDEEGKETNLNAVKAETALEDKKAQTFKNTGKFNGEQLTDTKGDAIVPNVAEAKKNAEQHIETEDMNNTTLDNLLDFIPNFFGDTLDDISSLGGGDGFSLDFNPFGEMFSILETDLNDEMNKIKSEV